MAQRKRHTAEFKAKVALEALKEEKTINQISSEFEVHAAQVSNWKKQALEQMTDCFKSKKEKKQREQGPTQEELYSQIGQLKVEVDWLKKKSAIFLER